MNNRIIFLIIFTITLLTGCSEKSVSETPPFAHEGIMDLRNWDLKGNDPIELNGEWEFYWKQFLYAEDFSIEGNLETPHYFVLPGVWNGYEYNGEELSAHGYGTYRLRLLIDDTFDEMVFEVLYIQTAAEIYLNGELVSSAGVPGINKESGEAGYKQHIIEYESEAEYIDIIIHVSNYDYRYGGIWETLTLGTKRDMSRMLQFNQYGVLFFLGACLMMGIYYLALSFIHKQGKEAIFFSLYCFVFALRECVTGNILLLSVFPHLPWKLIIILEYLTFFLSLPLFMLFIYFLFKDSIFKTIIKIVMSFSLLFSIITVLFSVSASSRTIPIFQIFVVPVGLYIVYILIRSFKRGDKTALILLLGFSAFFIAIINDVLFSMGIINTFNATSFGLLLFIISQSIVLTMRFANSFIEAEYQQKESEKLQTINRQMAMEITERKRVQAELLILNQAVEQSPITIVITDIRGNIEYVNPRFTEVTGYTSEEAIGQNPRILKSGNLGNEFYKNLWDTILSGNIWTGDFLNIKKDGMAYWDRATISPVFNDNKQIIRFIAFKEDITEQRAIEIQMQKLSSVVEHSPTAVVITDAQGQIDYVNPYFEQMSGYSKEYILGKNPRILKSGKNSETLYRDLWNTISNGNFWKGEIINCAKNGNEIWNSISITPLFNEDDNITHYVSIQEDITKSKQFEEELKIAKNEAVAATKAKGDFLANMSHEIRTPMNAIIGLNHLLSRTEMSNKQKDYVKKVSYSATGLLGIINDILDFSKIEAGKMDIEYIDFELNDVFENLLNLSGDKVREKGLDLIVDIDKDVPPFINGDSLRIGQILINFVSNAVKFTEKGEIRISCNLVSSENDSAVLKFSVKDSGIGLSEEQQNKLFQAFTQADTSTTRKYGGTGLGLSISKRLAELMGGNVGVEGELGVGSTFYFTISCKVLESFISKSKEDVSEELLNSIRGASILLTEDNEINQQVAVELLEAEGLYVDIADNGKIACDKIDEKEYDLVFMDLQMPEMNGFEATEKIRKEMNKKELPIIAMTADAMTGIEEKVIDAGMDDYITKPIDLEQLWKCLSQWIKPGERDLPKGYSVKDNTVAEESFPVIEGIDTEAGLIRVGNNQKLYRNLLKKFIDDYSDVTGKIAELKENGKVEEAIREAHSVKGVSANLGAVGLQEQMADVELKLKEGGDIKKSLDIADGIIGQLVSAISESGVLIEIETEDQSGETISSEDLTARLNEAVEHLSRRKPKPAIDILDLLVQFDISDDIKTQLKDAQIFLGKYKMKEALEILEAIRGIINVRLKNAGR